MISGILIVLGGLGLFLLGMVVMTGGLKSLAGDAFRRALARFTKSPLSGAVTGSIVTAVIQSSSVTTVTAVGFVGAGLLSFSQALGIIFGANIGTTATGWFVAILGFKLQIGEVALPLILVGVLMHLFMMRRASAAGLALAGFGLIFVGISSLQQGMAGLEGIVTPTSLPSDTLGGRLLLVLIGIGMTLITQSSSAGIATAMTALHAHTITFAQAAAMVIGMDIGTTVTALMASSSGSTDARCTALAHVVYNLLTGTVAFLFLTPYMWMWNAVNPDPAHNNPEIGLVAFHTLFNVLGVSLILPITGQFAQVITGLVPERRDRFTERLDRSFYASPAIVIEAVFATLNALALVVFEGLIAILERGPSADSDVTLSEANEALKRTRDYLEPVDTSADYGILYPKHVSSLHTIDHLRRLIDRCAETDRAERARRETDLTPFGAQLRSALDEAVARFGQPKDEPSAEKLKQIWQHFDSHAERYRQALIEDSASGRLDAYATIGKLDTLRWLRRVAYHVWRIVHHLERIQIDSAVQPAEDIPPHQEQDLANL